jgi:hypothetical protein
MKQRLAEILAGMHEHPYRQQAKDSAFDWLDRHTHLTIRPVAHWPTERTPRQFIARHGGGVRFSALDPAIQAAAMAQLTNWARATFGTLDTAATERQCFELKIYRFHQGTAA